MNVPLDNLYNWVEGLLPEPATLYIFYPHGSKEIFNFRKLRKTSDFDMCSSPGVIMHDQEPLNWNAYNSSQDHRKNWESELTEVCEIDLKKIKMQYFSNFNLKSYALYNSNLFDSAILVHSEKNSEDLEKYKQNDFFCVHYWAHAVIARDWYRFAEIDSRLVRAIGKTNNKFLIYCRDWSHGREYRLKFLEMLVQNNLDTVSQTSVMHTNSEGMNFLQYQFSNPKLELTNPELISQIPNNTFASAASADYNYYDFINSAISVVLETVFDDQRIHLTEKTLRPIACSHPFILAAGPGSLEYIRNYGFQTFAPWIDESYDLEIDSVKRLEKIILAMNKIQNLQGDELYIFSQNIKKIAEFNKKHFFSDEFFDLVKDELKTNLISAYNLVKKTQGKHYLKILATAKKNNLKHQLQDRTKRTLLLRQLRQSCPRDPSNPQEDPSV